MVVSEDGGHDGLADLRGFNPTKAQDAVIDRFMEQTGMSFSRLVDTALREFFEHRGHDWPRKYGRRKGTAPTEAAS